jgi:hypothetical protein
VKVRGLVVLVIAGGVGYWIYKTQPTVGGLVDGLTRPLMGSKAVVKESEHKRVIAEAVPAAHEGEQVPMRMVHEGMKKAEVEELLGRPDRIEEFEEKGKNRIRWVYLEVGRNLVFDEGRVISIEVR